MRGAGRTAEQAGAARGKLVTMEAVADYCDVDPRTVRRWVAEGKLTASKLAGYLVRIDLSEVDEKIIKPIPAGGSV